MGPSAGSPYNSGSVAHAIYCFLDGETLHGDPPKRELETPFVQTGIHNLGTNNRGAFVPLSSLKYVLLDSRAPSSEVDTARYQRVALAGLRPFIPNFKPIVSPVNNPL